MQPKTRRHAAAIAIIAILASASIPVDAVAKSSSHARWRSAAHRVPANSYAGPVWRNNAGSNALRGDTGTTTDWTAGWGNVGAD